jgi:hypothetical protein
METTYGVVWREGTLPRATGKLELLPRRLRLEGLADSRPVCREIGYDGLASVRIGRAAGDRIDGFPTVVLQRRAGQAIAIATVAQPSFVGDIAERLNTLRAGAEKARRLVLVLPLKPEAYEEARALLDAGPPFDPEKGTGLERHEVFLTSHEAVFLFESPLGVEALDPLLTEPDLLEAAAAWRDHLAGPPRLAENVYAWMRPEPSDS